MAGDKETPLMRQYQSIKNKNPETILLFRLGDFFETFGDDAVTTARVCGITLTKRNNGAAGEIPLAGFPHHQLDTYLPKIVRAGHRVAVCEQLEDPKTAKGIVKRDVVEVVTPGVALYDKLLDARRNTFVASLVIRESQAGFEMAGIAYADASTAEFAACECRMEHVASTLESIAPAEILIPKSLSSRVSDFLAGLPAAPVVSKVEDWIAQEQFSRELLLRHLRTHTLKGFGIDEKGLAVTAAGMVMHYIGETQQGRLSHFTSVRSFETGEYMTLDSATRRNLEIVSSSSEKDSSLVTVLDETQTPMGGRMLRTWLLRPLRRLDRISDRLQAVRSIVNDESMRRSLRDTLSRIGDLERLIGKVCVQRATPRELVALRHSLAALPSLHALESSHMTDSLRRLIASIDAVPVVVRDIEYALLDEPSVHFGTGAMFRPGYDHDLDEMRDAMTNSKSWVAAYQERLRQETGIASLKVSMNGVFGYYVEISNVHRERVPETFQRRQTMTNAERYITPELKEREELIMRAESGLHARETQLFGELRQRVAEHAAAIQHAASCVARLDCLASFAQVSLTRAYCEPEMDDDGVVEIDGGRHPVVERLLPPGTPYVPNSTRLDERESQVHILTGPNMAGKSCYLRQVGLITLLAHVGCFVPARNARISLCDRIFTRVGAQDSLATGESTFLVEMQEAANILLHATPKSLVLLDEVGRGTATFDGMSIAWAIAEYLHEHCGSKTLFATHYHELNDLAALYARIHTYKVDVQEVGNGIMFTRRVMPGSSDHSFGIHVARMAGLPERVTKRADEILQTLESNNIKLLENARAGSHAAASAHPGTVPAATALVIRTGSMESEDAHNQMSLFELRDDALRSRLLSIDVNSLTPMQALNILAELRAQAG